MLRFGLSAAAVLVTDMAYVIVFAGNVERPRSRRDLLSGVAVITAAGATSVLLANKALECILL